MRHAALGAVLFIAPCDVEHESREHGDGGPPPFTAIYPSRVIPYPEANDALPIRGMVPGWGPTWRRDDIGTKKLRRALASWCFTEAGQRMCPTWYSAIRGTDLAVFIGPREQVGVQSIVDTAISSTALTAEVCEVLRQTVTQAARGRSHSVRVFNGWSRVLDVSDGGWPCHVGD